MLVAACTDGEESVRLPSPNLDDRSASVRAAVTRAAAEIDELSRRATADARELAAAYGELAKIYMAVEELDAAIEIFELASELDPGNPAWSAWSGRAHHASGDREGARLALTRAIELDPEDVATMHVVAELELAEGAFDRAIEWWGRVLEGQPEDPFAYYGLGLVAITEGRPAEAVRLIERALQLADGMPSMRYALSTAYGELGDETARREQLDLWNGEPVTFPDPLRRELAELVPDPSRLAERGLAELAQGRLDESRSLLEDAVAAAPDSPDMWLNLGLALFESSDVAGARRAFGRALELSPDDTRALMNLGTLEHGEGNLDLALDYLARAVRADPGSSDAHLALADASHRTGKYEAALRHFEEAARLDPTLPAAQLGLGMTLVRSGRFVEARIVLERAFVEHPGRSDFAHALARLLATAPESEARDGKRALDLAGRLYAADPSLESARTVAMALAETGRYAEAAAWQQRTIDELGRDAPDGQITAMRRHLALYVAGRPCREFWSDESSP